MEDCSDIKEIAQPRDFTGVNSRFDYIDVAKGLGMLAIVWGHICYHGISNAIVYAFHIPLFFFLSGLVFSPKRYSDLGVFLKKRFKGLLFPYMIYSLLTWLVWLAYSIVTHSDVENYWMPLLQTFLAQGSENYLVHNVPLWFVMCLFSVEVAYYFISKLNNKAIIVLSVIIGIVGVSTTKATFYDFSKLPWSIDVAMMALPFYAAGSLLATIVSHQQIVTAVRKNVGTSVVAFVICASILYMGADYNGSISMGHADLGRSPLVFYFTAVFGVMAFMLACIAVSLCKSALTTGIKWIGRNSFRVMAIHNPIKGIVVVLTSKLLHTTTSSVNGSEWRSMIAFCITIVITLAIVLAIEFLMMKLLKRNSLLK